MQEIVWCTCMGCPIMRPHCSYDNERMGMLVTIVKIRRRCLRFNSDETLPASSGAWISTLCRATTLSGRHTRHSTTSKAASRIAEKDKQGMIHESHVTVANRARP
jgi:hypothetical protein